LPFYWHQWLELAKMVDSIFHAIPKYVVLYELVNVDDVQVMDETLE
jgi:hypothetical protein